MAKTFKNGIAASVIAVTIATAAVMTASHDVQAAPNLSGSVMSSKSSDRAVGRCSSDYMMCTAYIGSLCKRLVRRGMGGGSIRNCTVRKDKRCLSRLNRCLGKI